MAPQLRALAGLVEDPIWLLAPVPGRAMSFSDLKDTSHTYDAHIYHM